MFDVIDFLEKIGTDATWARASSEEILSGVPGLALTAAQGHVSSGGAMPSLSELLDGQPLYCMQFPADEESEEPEPEPEPGSGEPLRDGE